MSREISASNNSSNITLAQESNREFRRNGRRIRFEMQRLSDAMWRFNQKNLNFCNEYYANDDNTFAYCQKTLEKHQQTGCGLYYYETNEAFMSCQSAFRDVKRNEILAYLKSA